MNPSHWATYWDKSYAQSFTHFFPTARVLNKLTENISAPEIQALLDQLNSAVINNNSEESNRLFNAMLWVKLSLFNHDNSLGYFMFDIEDTGLPHGRSMDSTQSPSSTSSYSKSYLFVQQWE